jgi:CheY-like chemotaxis protein
MSNTDQSAGAEIFRGKRMLVVEDEFLIALDIQRILESAGVKTVLTASHVRQALELILSAGPFDAAVLDLMLDRETSAPVAERLQQARVPFVFLTGGPSRSDITRRFAQAPVVGKPFDGGTLLSALAEAMAAKPAKS